MRALKVNLDKKASSSYEIRIGSEILDRMAPLIAKNHPAGRHIIISDANVGALYGADLVTGLKGVA